MTTEFLHEHHAHNDHQAFTQLSRDYSQKGIHELFAGMTQKSVTFTKLRSDGKNVSFKLTADEASAFVDAWIFFQLANAAYEMEETLRKEQEELQEAERRGKVWLEVDQLAHSIPGMEIITDHSTEYNYDTGEDEPVTRWDVTLAQPQYQRYYLNTVDQVLANVKDLVEHYNNYVQSCEAAEHANWHGYHERTRQNATEFLAAHRAFVAEQQKHREEVTPATDALAQTTIE